MNRKPRSKRRPSILLALAAIIIPGVIAYVVFYLARPTGAGPAGPTINANAFSAVWTQRPVQVVGLGDSITAGLGANHRAIPFLIVS